MTKSLHSGRYAEVLVIIRASRQLAGLTQTEMAARLGKPQSYVSKLERGERRLDVVEFIDYVAATNRDPVQTLRALQIALANMKL